MGANPLNAAVGDGPGYVYALAHPSWPGRLKIGKTTNLGARLSQYRTGCPERAYHWGFWIWVPRYTLAERIAHERLKQFRVGSTEWFVIGVNDCFTRLRDLPKERVLPHA